MSSTSVKVEKIVTCEMCPAVKNTSGRYHKGKWFCSYTCVQEYERELNEESPFWRE
jgi:hypothetical protein